jgi:hypothetical protein
MAHVPARSADMSSMAESVQLPDDIQRRLNALKAVGALGICGIYGWFAIVKDTQVPVLVFLDIAVHEVGHKLFNPFGNLVMLIMGTGFQILFPFVVGLGFAVWKRDLLAWAICWAWSANAMCDGARYIYDAPRGELMLLGGGDGLGDWSKILGPEHFDKLYLADRLSAQVRVVGIVTWFVAVGLVLFALTRNARAGRRAAAAERVRATAKPSGVLTPVGEVDMWRR